VGLLDEDVLAGLNGGHHVEGVELGGVGDADGIDVLEDLLVPVEAVEALVVGHVHLVLVLPLQVGASGVDAVHEDIADGDEADALIHDADDVAALGVDPGLDGQRAERGTRGDSRRGLQEAPPRRALLRAVPALAHHRLRALFAPLGSRAGTAAGHWPPSYRAPAVPCKPPSAGRRAGASRSPPRSAQREHSRICANPGTAAPRDAVVSSSPAAWIGARRRSPGRVALAK